jgi:hypothetical protein
MANPNTGGGQRGPNPFPPMGQPGAGEPPLGLDSGVPPRPTVDRDNSGIVSTYEDMGKDDTFKTRKLPNPKDQKKGFFDGLFKKEK